MAQRHGYATENATVVGLFLTQVNENEIFHIFARGNEMFHVFISSFW